MNKVVVLVGRTNAGKSSLFNALIKKRISVVDATENLTNDVVKFELDGFELFDTPGIDHSKELDNIKSKTNRIDTVLIVADPFDISRELIEQIIRKCNDSKILLVINKFENIKQDFDFAIAGVEIIYVSAKTGHNLHYLRKSIGIDQAIKSPSSEPVKTWSIFGRSNVGKSTLANSLLSKDRFTAMDAIGTTREINRESIFTKGLKIELVDTPGYRKNNSIDTLAKASQYRLEEYISSKDLEFGLMLIDANQGFLSTDRKIIDQLLDSFIVTIVITKIDLVDSKTVREIKKEIGFIYPNLECITISSFNRTDIEKLLSYMINAKKPERLTTGKLNRWIRTKQQYYPIKYISQVSSNEFIVASRYPLAQGLIKNIENSLVQDFGLKGLRLKVTEIRKKMH